MRFIPTMIIAFLVAAMLCTGMADAQDDQLAGKWKMDSTTPDGNDVYWTLSITFIRMETIAQC
jgi:hypothetical protein